MPRKTNRREDEERRQRNAAQHKQTAAKQIRQKQTQSQTRQTVSKPQNTKPITQNRQSQNRTQTSQRTYDFSNSANGSRARQSSERSRVQQQTTNSWRNRTKEQSVTRSSSADRNRQNVPPPSGRGGTPGHTEPRTSTAKRILANTGRAAGKGVQDSLTGFKKTMYDIGEMASQDERSIKTQAIRQGIKLNDQKKMSELEAKHKKAAETAKQERVNLQEEQDKRQEEFDKRTKNAKGLEKALYGAVESGAGMLTDLAIGAATGTGELGALASMGARTYGQTRGQAEKEGATENEDRLNALLQAGKEVGTERILGVAGLPSKAYGKGALSFTDRIANKLTSKLAGRTADVVGAGARLAGGVAEENIEEFLGWGLDPVISEVAYKGNVRGRRQNEVRSQLQEESNALRSQVTDEATARTIATYLSSDKFIEENKQEYMSSGLSEKQAQTMAEQMRDYLTASLTGDTEEMERLEQEMATTIAGKGLSKESWDFGELAETIAATTLLTGATGLPGSVSSTVQGNRIKNELGENGIKALANTAIDFEDPEMSEKAQVMADRIASGKEITATQAYDLQQGMAKQIQKDQERVNASYDAAAKEMQSKELVSPYEVADDGSMALGEVTGKKVMADEKTAKTAIQAVNRENKDDARYHLSASEVQAGANAIAAFQSGIMTEEDANAFNYTNQVVRTAFTETTGIDLDQYIVKKRNGQVDIPATNAATKDALFVLNTENLVASAEAETANWMDVTRGEVVSTVSARMDANGTKALQQVLDNVDERDRSQYMRTVVAADYMYENGWENESEWDEVESDYTEMFPEIEPSVLRSMYEAGLTDRMLAEDEARGRTIEAGRPISQMGEQETATGNLFVESKKALKGTEIRLFTELASSLNADIHLVDNIKNLKGDIVVGANGAYSPRTNTFYLNVSTGVETNVGYIFMHEVTHYIKANAPEQYAALEKFVREKWRGTNAEQMQAEIDKKINAYMSEQSLTEEEALEEIIADAAHEFINDPDFAKQIAEDDPTLAKAIIDSIKNILRKLRAIFASGSIFDDTHMNCLFSELDIFTEAEALWLDAYKAAVKNRANLAIDQWAERSFSISDTSNESFVTLSPERINSLISEYAIPRNKTSDYSKAWIATINPRDFLKLTVRDEVLDTWEVGTKNAWGQEVRDLDKEDLKNTRLMPYLKIDTSESHRVIGHEGRHRMLALYRAGYTEVPVVIQDINEATKNNKQPMEEYEGADLWSQDFGNGPVNDDISVEVYDTIPINEKNRAEIERVYGSTSEDQVRFSISEGGYNGRSMSNRAVRAYESGEKPMSKWTKTEITDEILNINDELDLSALTTQELKDNFLIRSSWHHTGAFYNATDFYSIDEEAVENFTQDDIDDIANSRTRKTKTQEQREAEKKNREIVNESKDVLRKLNVIFKAGATNLKSLSGVISRWEKGNLDIDDMYQQAVDKVREEDARKVDQWRILPEDHWRHESVRSYDEDIESYVNGKYNAPGVQSKEFKRVKAAVASKSDQVRFSISPEQREDLNAAGIDVTESGTAVRYSYTSWMADDWDHIASTLKDAGYDSGSVDRWIESVNSVASIIAGDRARLDYIADEFQDFLKDNDEYYFTLDGSTLCKKRRLFQGTYNAVMHKLKNVPLLADDVIRLRRMMDDAKLEVPCGICYEESRKKHEGKFANTWLNGWTDKEYQQKLKEYQNKLKEYDKKLKEYNDLKDKGKKQPPKEPKEPVRYMGYANMEHDDPYIPTLAEVTTTDGRAKLREEGHTEALESYLEYQKGRGSANPKVSFTHTDYRGEIRRLTANDIKNLKHIGGLRIQSFSDFETPQLIDMMQAILDMAAKKLTSQAYTKVPDFAWAFGDTGIKINLSLIGKVKDGKLVFDSKEGIDPEEAWKLRESYPKNVGTIIVGANAESILAAWADPRIDMVIPFHRSGWSKAEFKKLGLGDYEDFQDYQSERYLDGSPNGIALDKVKMKPLYSADYWDFSKSGKENAETYLKLCAEQKRRPVFYNFLKDNGDGSWSLQDDGSTDGYWKSLIDYRMYDNEGVGSPQTEVTPNFNMEQVNRILGEFEGGADTLPVADDIVDQFVKAYAKKHPNVEIDDIRLSISAKYDESYMDAVERGDMDEAQRLVDEAAGAAGYDVKVYHQTAGDFTVFSTENPQAGRNDSETPNGIFLKTNNHDIGLEGKKQMAVYINSGRSLTFKNREEANKWYHDHVSGYGELDTVMASEVGAIDKKMNALEDLMFGEDVTDERYNELNEEWDSLLEEMHTVEDGHRGRLREILNDYFLNDNSEYDSIHLEYDGHRYVDGKREDVETYIVFKPEQIKLSDPVTYADDGSVIPLSERFDPNNDDIRYSMPTQDSEGNILTDGQMEYFKDSQVRDSEGRLMVMYHGTPNKVFTVFRTGSYFTPNKEYAEQYTNQGASSLGYKNFAENPGVYSCYLNITRPFDTRTPECREIFEREFYRQWGTGTPLMESGLPDWTDAEDLVEFIEEMGYEFDGVIVDEGAVGGYGDEVKKRGYAYIPFDRASQVKDIRNENPTENPDIRFSLPSEDEVNAYITEITEDIDDISLDDEVAEEGRVRIAKSKQEFIARRHLLWNERWLTEGKVLKESSVQGKIRQLVMGVMANSDTDRKYKQDIVDKLVIDAKEAYWKMKDGKEDEAADLLWDSALSMIENADFIDDTMFEQYKDLRDYLRNTTLQIGEEYQDDVNYREFQKKNKGRIKLKTGYTNIDSVYTEMQQLWPEWFNEDGQTTVPDQLLHIEEVLDEIQPYRYAYTSEEAASLAMTVANDLYDIIYSGEEYSSIADTYKRKYDEKTKALKARHEEALQKIKAAEKAKTDREKERTEKQKERAENWKRKYNERIQKDIQDRKKKTEKQDHRKKFDRIFSNYKDLCTWVLNPTKEKNVPEPFRKTIADFLQTLDLQTERSKELEAKYGPSKKTLQMRELKDKLKALSESKMDGDIYVPGGFELDAHAAYLLDKLSDEYDGKPVDLLDNAAIGELDVLLKTIIKNIKRYRQVKTMQRMVDLYEIGGRSVGYFRDKVKRDGVYGRHEGLLGAFETINATSLTPAYLFDRMGPLKEMYDVLRYDGFDKYIRNEKMIIDRLNEILGKFNNTNKKGQNMPGSEIEKWRDDREAITVDLSNGESVTMSIAQVMSLYCLAKRGVQAFGHMMVGGIVVTPIQTGSKIEAAKEKLGLKKVYDSSEKHVLSYEDIQNIISKLSEDQKNVADELQKLMSVDMAKLGNEAHVELYGYEMFKEDNYFPIKVHGNERPTDINNIGDVIEKIKSFGFTKPLTPNAAQAIEIDDIFSIVADHCNGMNLYNAYLVPITDFMKVFNYNHQFQDGDTLTMKEAITQAYGSDMLKYIMNLMKDINGIKGENRGGLEGLMNRALGRAKRTAVFGNIRVALQQPTAIIRALAEISPKYFRAVSIKQTVKGVIPEKATEAMEEMWKYCPIAQWKAWGYYDTYMGRDIEDVMMNSWSIGDKVLAGYYGQLDNSTWAMIWQAVKAEQAEKHPDMDHKSEEFLQLCGRRASEVFDKTQVVDSTFHRSDAMRSRQVAAKVFTAFMSEPTLTLNVFRAGLYHAAEEMKSGNKAAAANIIRKTVSVIVVQALLVSAAQAFADAWRGKDPGLPWGDDDDDKEKAGYFERWLHNFVYNVFDQLHLENNMYLVKDVSPYINYMFSQAADYGNWNPTFRAVMGWDQDYLYSQNNLVFAGLENTANGVAQLFKKLEKGDDYKDYKTKEPKKWYDIIQKISSGIGTFTGIPVGTLMRDLKPIIEMVLPAVYADETKLLENVTRSKSDDDGSKDKSKDTGNEAEIEAKVKEYEDSLGDKYSEDQKKKLVRQYKKTLKAEAKPEEDEEDLDYKFEMMSMKAEQKATEYSGADLDDALWDVVGEGYSKKLEEYDFEYIAKARAIYKANGGDPQKFDAHIVKGCKSAYKKTFTDKMTGQDIYNQNRMRVYMLDHGVTAEEISDMCYHTDAAKDLKAALRMNNDDLIMKELVPLVRAGLTRSDWEKLVKYQNYGAKTYDGKYNSPEYKKSTGTYVWPTQGQITSGFGYRKSPTAGASSNHPAIDIGAPQGSPVVAADGGKIIKAGNAGGYGNQVAIQHENGTVTYYSHLYSWNVKTGDTVAQGQQIGQVGSTGISTGPHLDFKVEVNGEPVNPLEYLS